MQERVSKLAIASLVTGFVLFVPVFSAIAAIALGVMAIHRIAENKGELKGNGFAVVGIILGVAQLISISVIASFFAWSSFSLLRYRSPQSYYITKATQYQKRGENKLAVQNYIKALEELYSNKKGVVQPDEFLIHHNLGVVLHSSGDYDKALTAYSNALKVADRQEAVARYGIGSIYMRQKQFDKALDEFDKAIALNSDMYDAYQNRAVTFRLMGRYRDSVNACREILDMYPKSAKTYCSLGWAYEKMGRFPAAIEAHTKAISLDPRWQFPKTKIVYCFSQLKDRRLASKLLAELEKTDYSLAVRIRESYLESQ
jgi:tetratricopeptide (TPR) repeat protein